MASEKSLESRKTSLTTQLEAAEKKVVEIVNELRDVNAKIELEQTERMTDRERTEYYRNREKKILSAREQDIKTQLSNIEKFIHILQNFLKNPKDSKLLHQTAEILCFGSLVDCDVKDCECKECLKALKLAKEKGVPRNGEEIVRLKGTPPVQDIELQIKEFEIFAEKGRIELSGVQRHLSKFDHVDHDHLQQQLQQHEQQQKQQQKQQQQKQQQQEQTQVEKGKKKKHGKRPGTPLP